MATLKDITKIKNTGDIQVLVTRMILQQDKPFNWESISEKIKSKLKELGVPDCQINTFRVQYMILDTLKHYVEDGKLKESAGKFYPVERTEERKVIYSFV